MFDLIGALILVILIVLFVFLIKRAWKVKNGVLKWIGTIISGIVASLLVLGLVFGLIGFYELNRKHDNPIADIQVEGTPEQIARGEQLAHICISCHTSNDQFPLAGTDFLDKFAGPPMGRLYAPNLTPSGNIADWTDGEVIRAIREGIHKNGRSLLVMPSENYRHMSDEDVHAVVAFLRSQPATGEPTLEPGLSLLGALISKMFGFFEAQEPVADVTAPLPGTLEYGKYMLDVLGCQSCHGEQLQGKPDTGQPGPPPGPNLTLIVPQWTEEQFMDYFNYGRLPGGDTVPMLTLPNGYTEPRMPWPTVRASTTDDELKAMYAYLHTLSPVLDNGKK
jgi:mono/diheme cytochrome c family protein